MIMHSATSTDRRPVAIIGAACRLPGAPDIDAFWDLLVNGRDTVEEIPPERFAVDRLYSAEPGAVNRINSPAGGFLPDIDRFDAAFFRISPHEAIRLDPQHRLIMEVTWEALDDAGIPAGSLAGSNTAVFSGCLSSDYWDTLRRAGVYDLHAAMGSGTWGIPAGRIAHHLDLHGPAMGVEAACATSSLAVHLACSSLLSGESDLAVVAAANLLMSPDFYLSLSEAQILSPRGRSRFGDAGADGYVRSEGVITLILKPEEQALRDGDRIYASILGSAVNNNGSTAGPMIAPGIEGQAAVLRAAYRSAGVRPADIDLVEAHGAGTPGGDFVELTALQQVLAEGRPSDRPCLIGSVKSNIGHTEVTAGAAGLLKVALALHHGTIPATLHVEQDNPAIDPVGNTLELVRSPRPWRGDRDGEDGAAGGGPILAGVSSFGLSGTNTHIVMTTAPRREPEPPERLPAVHLLPLSARDPQALRDMADDYADLLDRINDPRELHDLCASAGERRSHHRHRIAVVGTNRRTLADNLRLFSLGERPHALVGGDVRVAEPLRVVQVFSGHGAQWSGMARSLLAGCPTFADTLRLCSAALRRELGWSLLDRLAEERPLTAVDEVQPALWAIQVSLAAVWRDWGIVPDAVVGHSMGEVAAAVVSGALSIDDGAAVICRRARLVRERAEPGVMWAVQLGEEAARREISHCSDQVSVGVVNSAHSTVLSGEQSALEKVIDHLRGQGVFCRQVRVDYASHAPQVDPVRVDLLAALADLRPRTGEVPLLSTVTGSAVDGAELDAGYWWENLRRPVRFAEAVEGALADGRPTLFIEVSTHPLLLAAIEDAIDARSARAASMPSLVRDEPEMRCLLDALAHAYVLGAEPDWARVAPGGRFHTLPRYPWQRRRAWIGGDDDAAPAPDHGPMEAMPGSIATSAGTASGASATGAASTAGSAASGGNTGGSTGGNTGGSTGSNTGAAPVREPARSGSTRLVAEPAARPPHRSLACLTEQVARRVAEVLGMTPTELDVQLSPAQSGLDSLLAVKVREHLRLDLGVAIAVRDLLAAGTVAELARTLHSRVAQDAMSS